MNKKILNFGIIFIIASLTVLALMPTQPAGRPLKFAGDSQCRERETRCTGQVFRVCVNGRWAKKQLCTSTEDCIADKGCVTRGYLPTGFAKYAAPAAAKKGRMILEKGTSARKIKSTPKDVERERSKWQVSTSVGKPIPRAGFTSALIPEVTKEAQSVG